jgi:hypothetical protein
MIVQVSSRQNARATARQYRALDSEEHFVRISTFRPEDPGRSVLPNWSLNSHIRFDQQSDRKVHVHIRQIVCQSGELQRLENPRSTNSRKF